MSETWDNEHICPDTPQYCVSVGQFTCTCIFPAQTAGPGAAKTDLPSVTFHLIRGKWKQDAGQESAQYIKL